MAIEALQAIPSSCRPSLLFISAADATDCGALYRHAIA
jgi:hypothetical protein